MCIINCGCIIKMYLQSQIYTLYYTHVNNLNSVILSTYTYYDYNHTIIQISL